MRRHLRGIRRTPGFRERGVRYKKEGRRTSRLKLRHKRPVGTGEHAYAAVFERAEEGGYVVHFPAFGIATQGETVAEARAMARDLLCRHIKWLLRDGEELPPSDVARGLPTVEVISVDVKRA